METTKRVLGEEHPATRSTASTQEDVNRIKAAESSNDDSKLLKREDSDEEDASSDGSAASHVDEFRIDHSVEMVETFMVAGEPFANLKQRLRDFFKRGTLDDVKNDITNHDRREDETHPRPYYTDDGMVQMNKGVSQSAVLGECREN